MPVPTTLPLRGAAGLLVAVAALAVPPAAGAEEPAGVTAAEAMDTVMWSEAPIGGAFALREANGAPRTEADFHGKILLVYFGFTYCPDICPTDLMAISAALDELGPEAAEVQTVFITLDPERDSGHLHEYATAFHESFIGLTGDEALIRKTANDYFVYYRKVPTGEDGDYTIDHSAYTYVYDRDGDYLGFLPTGTTAPMIVDVLRAHLEG